MVVRSPPLTPVLGCAERARLGGCVLQVLEVSLGLLWFVFSAPESHYVSAAVVSAGGVVWWWNLGQVRGFKTLGV